MNSLMNTVTITPLYAALLGLVLLVLSGRVIFAVRAKGVSLGDGEDPDHLPIIRSQANFIEYVPMILILIGFAEAGGASDGWIHGLGGAPAREQSAREGLPRGVVLGVLLDDRGQLIERAR